jgi:hypothetical protein
MIEGSGLPATSESLGLSEFLDSIPVGHRRPRFQALAEAMLSAERPIHILETGCMRQSKVGDGPEADGCSSLVWDYLASKTMGGFTTVDINEENVTYTRSLLHAGAQVVCMDSVKFFSIITRSCPVDFLYLDSMDWQGTLVDRGLAALHHAAELSAAWPWLAPGALIAVDDCHGEYAGKHAIVKRFFDSIGIAPLADDFIHVWRKPLIEPLEFRAAKL